MKVPGISLPLSPVSPSRPGAALGDAAGGNPSCLCVSRKLTMTVPTHQDKPVFPRTQALPLPLFPPDVSLPQALPTFCNAHSSFQPRLGNRCAPHRELRCMFGAKGQRRKPERGKNGSRRPQNWGWGRVRAATAAQVTQVLYSHLSHFRLPTSHSHFVRGSWGLWFLFRLGTRSGSE